MARVSRYSLRKNAIRGAITTWCPECKRKAALGAWHGYRTCRYCQHVCKLNAGKRQRLYEQWQAEKEGEQDGR